MVARAPNAIPANLLPGKRVCCLIEDGVSVVLVTTYS